MITGWAAITDAELSEDLPASGSSRAARGDQLPYSTRFSGTLALDQEFRLGRRASGLVGASVSYVGERKGEFTGAGAQRAVLPDYTRADLHGGLRFGSWTTDLFINNVADERGLLQGGPGSPFPRAFQYIQPRTVGLAVARTF